MPPVAELTRKSFDIEIKDAALGTVRAIFSTFNVIDADGDVVVPGAIPETEVPLVIAHDWSSLPVGKGKITANRKQAVFEGQFFMETEAGREAFLTVKAMGKTQQYSWGFKVLESDFGQFEERDVRFIRKTQPFEVSPVIVGSNPVTGTIDIKGTCPTCGRNDDSPEPESPDLKATPDESDDEPPVEVGGWQQEARIQIAYARMDCN